MPLRRDWGGDGGSCRRLPDPQTKEPSLEAIHADLFSEDEEPEYYPPQPGDIEF